METLKLTPIDEIEDMADGVPVLAVEGTVKYARDLKRSPEDAARPWTKQFFVLTSGTAEIACSMWDAEGNELSKGEKVHIENTQNKKGQWNGMVKGSYQKDGERKHTLEIRANQVKITQPNGDNNVTDGGIGNMAKKAWAEQCDPDPNWPEAPHVQNTIDWPESSSRPIKSSPKRPSMLDERQRAIIRQHSQSMALEVLKLKIGINQLILEDLTPSKLKTLADYFDNDVMDAAQ